MALKCLFGSELWLCTHKQKDSAYLKRGSQREFPEGRLHRMFFLGTEPLKPSFFFSVLFGFFIDDSGKALCSSNSHLLLLKENTPVLYIPNLKLLSQLVECQCLGVPTGRRRQQ